MSSFLALKLFKLKPSWLAWFWADFGFLIRTSCSYAMVAGRRLSWNPHGEIVKGTCSTIGDFLVHVHAAKMTQGTVLVRLETKHHGVLLHWATLKELDSGRESMWVLEGVHWKTCQGQLDDELGMIGTTFETWQLDDDKPHHQCGLRDERVPKRQRVPFQSFPHDQLELMGLTGEDSGGCWALRSRSQKYFLGSGKKWG